MLTHTHAHSALTVLLIILAPMATADEGLSRPEIAKLAKPATALVEVEATYGSGFCVHPSGLFITNAHLVNNLLEGRTVTIVLDAGLKTQQTLKAKVVRRDKELDLALLRVEGKHQLPTLALGSDEGLAELTELIAFGFPFGTALAKPGEYPAISVNVGSATSLRRDANRDLHRIQLDAALNPGNSGGPVLDRSGKVVGVVVGGIRGAGINLAIPVSHVSRFLARPDIALTAPIISPKGKHEPVEFRATAVALLAPANPLELELILTNFGGAQRRFAMKAAEGLYWVLAVPFPASKDSASLRLEVKYKDGSVSGLAEDCKFTVGKQPVQLSEVRELRLGTTSDVLLRSGQKLEGPLADLDSISVNVGGNSLSLKLASALEVRVVPIEGLNSVSCTVVARQTGKEVGRHNVLVYLEGTERATLEAIRDGKFVKPLQAVGASSYLKAVSSQGDFIGQGKAYTYEGNQLTVRGHERGLSINVDGWHIEFAPPRNQALKVGEYPNAKRYPFNEGSPGINFSGHGRGCNRIAGAFVIWELELRGNEVVKLAVDFIQKCEETMPPLYGMLRYNSSFE